MNALLAALALAAAAGASLPDARAIVQAAIDHHRGETSYSEAEILIHRPDWERRMAMRIWTRGDKDSLVRVTAPAKDAGSATLVLDKQMWTYSPKVDRAVRVPSSMMSQSWMGSDFTNDDLAKGDDVLKWYDHVYLSSSVVDGKLVHEIEARPHEDAPVVWGREVVKIREDHVVLEQAFYDQGGRLVKTLRSLEIGALGGRTLALRQRMVQADAPEEWTEVSVKAARFGLPLRARLFTLADLAERRE